MAGQFEGSAVIDRPIDDVFAFLADGADDFANAIKRAVEAS